MVATAWASERAEQALMMIEQGALLIDVRTPQEYAQGHLPGSINLPLDQFEEQIASVASNPEKPVVLYCRSGNRSGIALDLLQEAGYTRAHNGGGLVEIQQSQ